MDDAEAASALPQPQRTDLPVRRVTVNSIVAFNMAFFRKAAGLKQEELAEHLGWGKTTVSTAERSWDAKRVRSFSAEDLIAIAVALEIPLAALFLPPEDNGVAFRYVLDMPGAEIPDALTLLYYVFPAYHGDSPAMEAYRKRLIAAGASGRVDILDDAWREADRSLEAARRETERVLETARRQAEQLTGDARARALSLEQDAQERHRQAVISLVEQREQLEQRIDDLRAFEREYRTGLQAWLERGLLDLWTPEVRPERERLIKEVRDRAAEGTPRQVTALLLREDGTYDVVEFGPSDGGEGGAEDDPGQGGGGSP